MASNKNLFIIIINFMIIFINKSCTCNTTRLSFSSIIIFGDSTVDTGNNNYINTIFKGNHYPYGKDFTTPTGRFSNGKLVPDFLASSLGIKESVPPFLDPKLSDDQLITGVSFASAGSGLDDLTTALSKVIPVSKQIEIFRDNYIVRLNEIVGEEKAKKIISDALIIISAGTNDFGFNFYDLPTRRFEFNITGYQDFLQARLQSFVKELYDLGCRRMIIAGLPPIGCLPIQMTAKFNNPLHRKCLENENSDAQSYNHKLAKLLPQMQALLPHSKLVFADIYVPLIDMIDHPQKYGFVETKRGCCGTGLVEVAFLCNAMTLMCGNASQFLFWDCIHPTQSAYQYITKYLEIEILSNLMYDQSLG